MALAITALMRRRSDHHVSERNVAERATAIARGSHRARLQYPSVDLSNCIGCGACVRACPEDGVLQMAYGQAVIVHGARCIGHGLCASACPTAAIALTLSDLATRKDLPAINNELETVGTPGLFLAGEITGFALVRTAVTHGSQVARLIAARLAEMANEATAEQDATPDLLVVGLGPAGLSCMLAATEAGMHVVGIDQAEEIGGTVAAYPRRKLVMTQPIELPLHGRLKRLEYTKEQLVELWQGLAEQHNLEVQLGTTVDRIERQPDGTFIVTADERSFRARTVCLAVGRRGTPRRLNVDGEDLPKVAYSLLDAVSYQGKNIVVVGGGDSAIEAALALAEQPGNVVTLSYRKQFFSRIKAKNEARIQAAIEDGLVVACLPSVVRRISTDEIVLDWLATAATSTTAPPATAQSGGEPAPNPSVAVAARSQTLANDHVFIFAGGTPPFALLAEAGVSFDPSMRPSGEAVTERATGLLVAMAATLAGLITLVVVRSLYSDYYKLPIAWRPSSEHHGLLRPQGQLGLLMGMLAMALFMMNLTYLLRRSLRIGHHLPGTLKSWMSLHVATGLGACLLAILHSAFSIRDSAGGHALLLMVIVVLAGIVGRWFYAFVPRAQNGRQQDIEELGDQVSAIAGEWDRSGRGFSQDTRRIIDDLVAKAGIGKSFFSRVWGLLRSQALLRGHLARFEDRAKQEGMPASRIARVLRLARRSHGLALQLAHYDDLRGLLSTWRWLHRWLALLLLTLTTVHIASAWRFGGIDFGVLFGGGGR